MADSEKVSLLRAVGSGLLNVFFPLIGASIDKRAANQQIATGKHGSPMMQEANKAATRISTGSFWGALGGTLVGALLFTPFPIVGSVGSSALAGVGNIGAFGLAAFAMVTAVTILGRLIGSFAGGRSVLNYLKKQQSSDTIRDAINDNSNAVLFTAFFGKVANKRRVEQNKERASKKQASAIAMRNLSDSADSTNSISPDTRNQSVSHTHGPSDPHNDHDIAEALGGAHPESVSSAGGEDQGLLNDLEREDGALYEINRSKPVEVVSVDKLLERAQAEISATQADLAHASAHLGAAAKPAGAKSLDSLSVSEQKHAALGGIDGGELGQSKAFRAAVERNNAAANKLLHENAVDNPISSDGEADSKGEAPHIHS